MLSTKVFTEGVLDFARRHASAIRRITEAADERAVQGTVLAVRARPKRSAERVEILLGEVEDEVNPYSTHPMRRRLDVVRPVQMYEYTEFEAEETERVPGTYFIPPTAENVLAKLDAHGVKYVRLRDSMRISVQVFRIDSMTTAERAFQQHNERTIFGAYRQDSRWVPAGTAIVPTNQPLGRLVFALLEPRFDDGLVDWNVVDPYLEGATEYPILRSVATFNVF